MRFCIICYCKLLTYIHVYAYCIFALYNANAQNCQLTIDKRHQALGAIYRTFLRPGKNLKKLGQWAVVTGATDGIGKAYALGFAKKGMSVVLISRTESKLADLKKEIDAKGYDGVEVKYVVCDYSNFDEKAQSTVAAAIGDLDVGVLINNVGVSYRYPRFFHELTDDEVHALYVVYLLVVACKGSQYIL